jgi:hypothetical protein
MNQALTVAGVVVVLIPPFQDFKPQQAKASPSQTNYQIKRMQNGKTEQIL